MRALVVDRLAADYAGVGVIARIALADVVQEGADEEEVGSADVADQHRRLRCGLHQVAIDGEAMEGVALRPVAHCGPFGQDAGDEVVLVERLHRRHRRRTGAEQRDQAFPGEVRPRTDL